MRGAFFRCLNGSRRISLSDLRFFMPSLTAEELLLPDFWS
ncbi:plasmid SOS inhibition PsiA domain protein [Escherichia coli DEC5B]|nr:plasmid SOS inhibition PsiA domain protein [Escherichia coli DEC5B]